MNGSGNEITIGEPVFIKTFPLLLAGYGLAKKLFSKFDAASKLYVEGTVYSARPTKYPESISLTGEYTPRVDTIGLLRRARENEKNLLLIEDIGTPMNAQEVNRFDEEFLAMSNKTTDKARKRLIRPKMLVEEAFDIG